MPELHGNGWLVSTIEPPLDVASLEPLMPPELLSRFLLLPLPAADPDGQWHGSLMLQGADDSAEFEATAELLSYFARFTGTGALAAPGSRIESSRLAVDVKCQRGRLEADLIASNLHPGSWRVLMQMLAHCHQMEPYQAFTLRSGQGGTEQWHADRRLIEQPYPSLWPASSGLHVTGEQSLSQGADMAIRLSSARKLDSAEIRAFAQMVEDWGSLVYTGGYTAVDVLIDQPLLDPPSTARAGSSAIDVIVGDIAAPSEALHALLNLSLAVASRFGFVHIEIT